jgi:hypothetical protein
MEHEHERRAVTGAGPATTGRSIAIFATVVALLFGGMYFFLSDGYRTTATTKSPTVAQPATPPAPPATTGQGGNRQ